MGATQAGQGVATRRVQALANNTVEIPVGGPWAAFSVISGAQSGLTVHWLDPSSESFETEYGVEADTDGELHTVTISESIWLKFGPLASGEVIFRLWAVAPQAPFERTSDSLSAADITTGIQGAEDIGVEVNNAVSVTQTGAVSAQQSGAWNVGQSSPPWSVTVSSGTVAATQSGAWAVTITSGTCAVTQSTDPWVVVPEEHYEEISTADNATLVNNGQIALTGLQSVEASPRKYQSYVARINVRNLATAPAGALMVRESFTTAGSGTRTRGINNLSWERIDVNSTTTAGTMIHRNLPYESWSLSLFLRNEVSGCNVDYSIHKTSQPAAWDG